MESNDLSRAEFKMKYHLEKKYELIYPLVYNFDRTLMTQAGKQVQWVCFTPMLKTRRALQLIEFVLKHEILYQRR